MRAPPSTAFLGSTLNGFTVASSLGDQGTGVWGASYVPSLHGTRAAASPLVFPRSTTRVAPLAGSGPPGPSGAAATARASAAAFLSERQASSVRSGLIPVLGRPVVGLSSTASLPSRPTPQAMQERKAKDVIFAPPGGRTKARLRDYPGGTIASFVWSFVPFGATDAPTPMPAFGATPSLGDYAVATAMAAGGNATSTPCLGLGSQAGTSTTRRKIPPVLASTAYFNPKLLLLECAHFPSAHTACSRTRTGGYCPFL